MLKVDVQKQLGDLALAVQFESRGLVTGLFGPSGAGKTSLVNMIAGLMRPDSGRIALDDVVLDNVATREHVPPHRRHIGYVFQESRLFPHLSVRQNLDYGRRMNGLPRNEGEEDKTITLLGIAGLLDRRPAQLSGGEKQRIALGRALLTKPRLLLLDEPLGSLDDERKSEILPFLIRLRDEAKVPMVYVSHDTAEMRELATNVVILKRGAIVAQDGVEILPVT
ncbi:MAG: molybdenum ABC transporter ATP-binding protein [Afipia sp.]|nr:molybdenum ABC transporter ATP-binding protein [Afipia sp.]